MGCDATGWNKAKSCAGRRLGGCYALPFSLPLAMALNCALPAVLFAQTAMHTMLPVWHGVRFRRCPVHDDKVDAGKRQIKLAFLEHAAGNGSLLPLLHGQGCFCLRKKARGCPPFPGCFAKPSVPCQALSQRPKSRWPCVALAILWNARKSKAPVCAFDVRDGMENGDSPAGLDFSTMRGSPNPYSA